MARDSQSDKVSVNVTPADVEPGDDTLTPPVDVYEDADGAIVLVADMPGATAEDLDLRVEKGVLTIYARGVKVSPGGNYSPAHQGFSAGPYFRAFALGDEIDGENIEARLAEGVLTLRCRRARSAKARKIPIRTE